MSYQTKLRFQGNSVSIAPSSNYPHWSTSLGRFDNKPIAISSGWPYTNTKVEELRNELWNTLGDIPFIARWIINFSTVTFNKILYLFGKL